MKNLAWISIILISTIVASCATVVTKRKVLERREDGSQLVEITSHKERLFGLLKTGKKVTTKVLEAVSPKEQAEAKTAEDMKEAPLVLYNLATYVGILCFALGCCVRTPVVQGVLHTGAMVSGIVWLMSSVQLASLRYVDKLAFVGLFGALGLLAVVAHRFSLVEKVKELVKKKGKWRT